jgi:hypothetical protein
MALWSKKSVHYNQSELIVVASSSDLPLAAVPLPNCGYPKAGQGVPKTSALTYVKATRDQVFATAGGRKRSFVKRSKSSLEPSVHCLEAQHLIEPADSDIGVVAIDFNA